MTDSGRDLAGGSRCYATTVAESGGSQCPATLDARQRVPPRNPSLFQRDCWDRQLRTGESYSQKWEYVRNNPHIDQLSVNFHTPFSETEELFLEPEIRNTLIDKLIDYKRRCYPIMNSRSGLRAMKMRDGKTICTDRYCWVTNFIFSDGSRSPKCMGYMHGVCDRCGFSMGGEMYAMQHFKPDTLLSGLKLRM